MSVSGGGSQEKERAGPCGAGCAVWVLGGHSFGGQQETLQFFSRRGNEYDSTLIFRNARTLAVSSYRRDRGKERGRLHLEATAVVLDRGHVRIAQLGEACAGGGWEWG